MDRKDGEEVSVDVTREEPLSVESVALAGGPGLVNGPEEL